MIRASLLAASVLFVLTGLANADPKADYHNGRNAYLYGDFKATIKLLDPLVRADPIKLVDRDKITKALEMLGLSRYYLGEEEEAKLVFERLIFHDLEHSLNPITAPPDAVALYDALKGELAAEIERRRIALEEKRRAEQELTQTVVKIDYRKNSRVLAAMPFGIGQFQNDDDLWGGLFLGSELIAIALSVSFFLAAEDLRNAEGLYERADIAQARNFQTAQLVSGGVAVALMIGGAVHALATFQDRKQVDREVIPPKISPAGSGVLIEF